MSSLDVLKKNNLHIKILILLLLMIGSIGCLLLSSQLRTESNPRLYLFLYWNLFLAWLPVGASFVMDVCYPYLQQHKKLRLLLLLPLGLLWLLFYPNAAYLMTDLVHPVRYFQSTIGYQFIQDITFWKHLFTFVVLAFLGLFLSVYSLYTVQQLVRRSWGAAAGWVFALAVLWLSSLGIYVGRFVRWNSWDVFSRPEILVKEFFGMLIDPLQRSHLITFTVILYASLLLIYCIAYCFTYLRPSGGQQS